MHTFTVRPGYGTEELLIEFEAVTEPFRFLTALEEELDRIDATRERTHPSLFVLDVADDVLIEYDSQHGPFELSMDWTNIPFVLAPDNGAAIDAIAELLRDSDAFAEETADFDEYR